MSHNINCRASGCWPHIRNAIAMAYWKPWDLIVLIWCKVVMSCEVICGATGRRFYIRKGWLAGCHVAWWRVFNRGFCSRIVVLPQAAQLKLILTLIILWSKYKNTWVLLLCDILNFFLSRTKKAFCEVYLKFFSIFA